MQRPSLIVKKEVTTIGAAALQDGTSLLVVSAPAAYAALVNENEFVSLKGAEAAGITAANDIAQKALVWEHVKDFFALASGTPLHVLLVPQTATGADSTFKDLFDGIAGLATHYGALKTYLQTQGGDIKLVGVAVNPADGVSEADTTSISADLEAAITHAHTFANGEFEEHRPVEIILENRKFTGTATAATDLRAKNAGNVMVVSSRDKNRRLALEKDVDENPLIPSAVHYAAVGLALGKAASIQVNQNIGRLTVPPLFQTKDNLPVEEVEFSGAQSLNAFDKASLDMLHNKGYTFIDRYAGYAGFYFVNDNTCEDATKSNSRLSLNRVANKAARITRATFLNFLKATIQVDGNTGQLLASVVERFKDVITRAITEEMLQHPDPARLPEISSVEINIDPTQNVLSTKKVVINQSIVPTGSVDVIETIISLDNPS
ncbi:DUF2586 family protein [Microscilla marina]|uniref:Uncharacterized protein n=1 Tax=Microscilla marina ATCC 23134 TaxID=313606 RepID=A1ZLH5_MICM2|nr:DUF2586 family protein [Microscilla marina]EAY28729.1 hypothetical protein M23134_07827 [Microscilla marina ATCC 23134]